MALIHAFLVITLRVEPDRLGARADDLRGSGLSSYLANDLEPRATRRRPPRSRRSCRSGLRDAPVVGPILFDQNALVYVSWVVRRASCAWYLARTRPGPERARGRRVARGRRRDGDQRDRLPLRAHARRRRVRGRRRRDVLARDHAAVGRRPHRRRRLDRDRARDLRLLAAGALPRRRVPLRRVPGAAVHVPGEERADRRSRRSSSRRCRT